MGPSTNYESTLRNIPEEGRSHLQSGRSLKSRWFVFVLVCCIDIAARKFIAAGVEARSMA